MIETLNRRMAEVLVASLLLMAPSADAQQAQILL